MDYCSGCKRAQRAVKRARNDLLLRILIHSKILQNPIPNPHEF